MVTEWDKKLDDLMRIGLGLTPPFDILRPIEGLSGLVTQAEADGFAAVWAPSLPSVGPPDALVLLGALGPATSRIELGSYVVPTFPRHPAMLAQQALTVQQLSASRLALGIGLSHKPVIEGGFGLDFSHPIRHMREYLTVLMPLLAGEAVQVSGQDYRVQQQPRVPSGVAPPPVLVAALQPQMLRLAGELADGTALGAGGPHYIETMAVPHITEAARAAGRPAPRVAALFPIAVTSDRDGARAATRAMYPGYERLPSYRALLDLEGLQDMGDLAISGEEAQVRQQLRRLREIGVTDFVASRIVVEGDPDAYDRTYQLLADVARLGLS